jgi:ABC-2 type transport system ATP-binding protein
VSAAVEVGGVTKRFGGALALDDVSFSIKPGAVLALLGPNGAGKTTFIRVVTRLLAAGSGRAG